MAGDSNIDSELNLSVKFSINILNSNFINFINCNSDIGNSFRFANKFSNSGKNFPIINLYDCRNSEFLKISSIILISSYSFNNESLPITSTSH